MTRFALFALVAGAAGLVGCASQPAAPATAAGPARPAVHVAARAAPSKKVSSDFPGYQRVVVKGQALYCRYEPYTGTHIRRQICLTRSQLQAEQTNAQSVLQQTIQHAAACNTAVAQPGGGGNCEP